MGLSTGWVALSGSGPPSLAQSPSDRAGVAENGRSALRASAAKAKRSSGWRASSLSTTCRSPGSTFVPRPSRGQNGSCRVLASIIAMGGPVNGSRPQSMR